MLLMGKQGESSDLMWTVSSDSFPFHNQLMESYVSSFQVLVYQMKHLGPVIQIIVSLTSPFVVKMLTSSKYNI